MTETYNANMYLAYTDLNMIENKIEELTNKISQKIYSNEKTYLRNIVVGDNLSNTTLVCNFPRDMYEDILNNNTTVLTADKGSIECYDLSYDNGTNNISVAQMVLRYKNQNIASLYYYIDDGNNKYHNPSNVYFRVKIPSKFGKVLTIDNDFSQYIYIYNEKDIIPEYNKKIWTINEIPYVQDIDHIEYGIELLGDYAEKPNDWIESRKWDIGGNDTSGQGVTTGVAPQGFSYIDINRWVHNLNLIDSIDMDNITLWNTNKSQYYWNEGE